MASKISFTKKGFVLHTNLFSLSKEGNTIFLTEKPEVHEKKEKRCFQINLSLIPFAVDMLSLIKEGCILTTDTYDVVVSKMKKFFRDCFSKNEIQEPFGFHKETQEATFNKSFNPQEKKYTISSDKKFTILATPQLFEIHFLDYPTSKKITHKTTEDALTFFSLLNSFEKAFRVKPLEELLKILENRGISFLVEEKHLITER